MVNTVPDAATCSLIDCFVSFSHSFFFSHVIYVSQVALTDIYLTMACPILGSLDWAALFSLSFGSVTPSY